jgi:Spy/CpxP family protein refolding chaperone
METGTRAGSKGRAWRFGAFWGLPGLAAAVGLAVLASHAAGAFGRHAHGFPERRIEHLLDEVEASDAQREQIRGAMDELHDLWRASRRDRRESREAIAAALTGDEIDREALEALRAAQIESFEAMSQRLLATLVQVAEVLTPEQRREIAAYLEEHREHRGRHGWH